MTIADLTAALFRTMSSAVTTVGTLNLFSPFIAVLEVSSTAVIFSNGAVSGFGSNGYG